MSSYRIHSRVSPLYVSNDVPSGATGPGSARPIGFGEDLFAELFLRARRFAAIIPTYSGSGTQDNEYNDAWSISVPGTTLESTTGDHVWEDERYPIDSSVSLDFTKSFEVEAPDGASYDVTTETSPGVFDTDTIDVDASSTLSIEFKNGLIADGDPANVTYFAEGLYWPVLSMTLSGSGMGTPSVSATQLRSDWLVAPESWDAALELNCKFLNQDVLLKGGYNLGSTGARGFTGPAEVTIAEWWPYGGQWNPTTGAPA